MEKKHMAIIAQSIFAQCVFINLMDSLKTEPECSIGQFYSRFKQRFKNLGSIGIIDTTGAIISNWIGCIILIKDSLSKEEIDRKL